MNPGVPPLSILRVMFPTMLDYDLAQLTASEVRLRMRQYVNAQKCWQLARSTPPKWLDKTSTHETS